MSEAENTSQETDVLYCTVHPTEATQLRCNKCGRPMCTRCAVRTPVGYRCRECVRGQQKIFYNANELDPLIQGGITFVLGGVAAGLFGLLDLVGFGYGFLGWLIAFWAGSAVGAGIADIAHRAVGKRRGRYSWIVVVVSLILGALAVSLGTSLFLRGFLTLSLSRLIFIVMAAVAAAGRLRIGRRNA